MKKQVIEDAVAICDKVVDAINQRNSGRPYCQTYCPGEPALIEKLNVLVSEIKNIEPECFMRLSQELQRLRAQDCLNLSAFGGIVAIVSVLKMKYVDNSSSRKKVFISHSSNDVDILEKFVDHILGLGIGINANDIFCSSIEGMDIKNGEDLRRHIQSSIRIADFSYLMISEHYKQSEICLNEMGAVWASAMIQKTAKGSGINVKILDYNGQNNITTITANQYKNAALTAGIEDANIYVTSARPIDGSGALAGIYTAYAKNGDALNQKQVNAAQDEMGTLSTITKENKEKDGYSDAQLNNAVASAKSEMAKIGNNISDSQIRDIVNNQIKINHLGDTINNNQKNQIINVLIEIRDSGALNNDNFKEQASKLSQKIQDGAKGIFDKFNTPENRNWFQQIIDSITNFFKGLFGVIIIK